MKCFWDCFKDKSRTGEQSSTQAQNLRVTGEQSSAQAHNLSLFSFSDLKRATSNFNRMRIISGDVGFPSVYRGMIESADGEGNLITAAAIKKWGGFRWVSDVKHLGIVEHPNVVKLIGFCGGEGDSLRLLVYEFMPNKSLEDHLFNEEYAILPWETRLQILLGAAEGLAYLHELRVDGRRVKVTYRDFKSSNVLLDGNFRPKLCGFSVPRERVDKKNVITHVAPSLPPRPAFYPLPPPPAFYGPKVPEKPPKESEKPPAFYPPKVQEKPPKVPEKPKPPKEPEKPKPPKESEKPKPPKEPEKPPKEPDKAKAPEKPKEGDKKPVEPPKKPEKPKEPLKKPEKPKEPPKEPGPAPASAWPPLYHACTGALSAPPFSGDVELLRDADWGYQNDVSCFGMVLCEMLTGRRSPEKGILECVKQFPVDRERVRSMMDPRLENHYSLDAAIKVAMLADRCLLKPASRRPKMGQVVETLQWIVQGPDEVNPPHPSDCRIV